MTFALRQPGRRRPRREDAFPLAYYVAVAAVLAAVDYPVWRVAVLALAAALQQVQVRIWGRLDATACAAGPAWRVVCSQMSYVTTIGLTVAVTGGVESPLLLTFITPYFAALAVLGRRETRLLLGTTALGICVFALSPHAWTGPELPRSIRAGLVVVSFLGVAALLAPLQSALRKRSEELSRAREELASEALARAHSLEQVGAKVAHELKNPLTALKALVQLGLRNPSESPSHGRLQVFEKEVTRMQAILHDYLSFSRPLQEVRPRRTELGPLVGDTLLVLSARADHAGVRLSSRGDATVEADPRRLKEALLNLVANAIEATPPGGVVDVEVRPSGDHAEIAVRDTGRGMPPETLRRLGIPFFTTREDGTGLGVVLARSVVVQHGGSLRYDSSPGKGTTVTATLPTRLASRCPDTVRAAGGG
jgi:two-component system, NtrC family, sensor histidine kinase HydH